MEKTTETLVEPYFELLKLELQGNLSPQLRRRISHLIESTVNNDSQPTEVVRRISSVFDRLLLELIQAHYNTKQREQDFLRLVKSRGCIVRPDLIDVTLDLLLKLHKATGQCFDTSFERKILIKYLLKELEKRGFVKNQVERIVQTLYRCSFFHVISKDGDPARFKLKEELASPSEMRLKHDSELIKMAVANLIRLPPDSWAYLLYHSSNTSIISAMQSLLDKHQTEVSVKELQECIIKTGDKYGLDLQYLQQIQDLIKSSNVEIGTVVDLLEKLLKLRPLFVLRQHRNAPTVIQNHDLPSTLS